MTRDEAQSCGQCECCAAWRRERDAALRAPAVTGEVTPKQRDTLIVLESVCRNNAENERRFHEGDSAAAWERYAEALTAVLRAAPPAAGAPQPPVTHYNADGSVKAVTGLPVEKHLPDAACVLCGQLPAGAPPALVALESIAMAARRGLAFGHQATPQTPERMIERKEQALGQILDMCERHGITSSVLRGSPAPAPATASRIETCVVCDGPVVDAPGHQACVAGRYDAVVCGPCRAELAAPAPVAPPAGMYGGSCEGCPYPDTCSWFRKCTFKRSAPPAVVGGDAPPECPECDGDGYTEIGPVGDDYAVYQIQCKACRGTGRWRQEGQ